MNREELQKNIIYKVARHSQGNYYLILNEDESITVYLSNNEEIFSVGKEEIPYKKFADFFSERSPIKCSINEEAKVRLMINIFNSEQNDNN